MGNELIALYELRRQSFLIGFIQNPDNFDNALAYAYDKRIPPIFHQAVEREIHNIDPFANVYSVSPNFIATVIDYLDKKWLANKLEDISFYKIEKKYGRAKRIDLKHILAYCRINNAFDDGFWSAVEEDAPSEANKIPDTFEPKDVYFS